MTAIKVCQFHIFLRVKNSYGINRKIVFVMRLLSVAKEGIKIVSDLMDLGKVIRKNPCEIFIYFY